MGVELSGADFPWNERENTDVESIKRSIINHLHYTLAKDRYSATKRDCYNALALMVRDHLVRHWIKTQQSYYHQDVKRVYYLSLEFLIGRTLANSLINLQLFERAEKALDELGLDINALRELEWDAGLGNGGLGRLAACFLDSLATLGIPAYGYGLRYEYGIFYQEIQDGFQVERPDNWLRYGNPWEIGRPEYLYPVHFGGRVQHYNDDCGHSHFRLVDTEEVMAMAYDTPIPGYGNSTVNTMRLWGAKSSRGFELSYFNDGDYISAVEAKNRTENITRVLYPVDNYTQGKELRLKQEYFLVSATLQDIIRRYLKTHTDFEKFPHRVAIQLNDTHPALAVPELMRILIDENKLPWELAWKITQNTCAYTNHTVLPEALETWGLDLMNRLLPRQVQIIYEINKRFMKEVETHFSGDGERRSRMSVFQEGEHKNIRMANLAVIGCHQVNGVSQLHTEIIKSDVFRDFYEMYPNRFTSKTNGITPRRWLLKANPLLSGLITEQIGDRWITHLQELQRLEPLADDPKFRQRWAEVKLANKQRLAERLKDEQAVEVNIHSLFDCQVKRIHEYKRQLLLILYTILRYNRIKNKTLNSPVARTIMIGGKAAPAYHRAKLIIKLANAVAETVNTDPVIENKLNMVFLTNYRVSSAERIIPATELSEQISLAGTEASGTGNMKFALNGALTIGTLDGANVEMREEVGDDNIYIFGMKSHEVKELKSRGYDPRDYYHRNAELKEVLEMIRDGYFLPQEPDLFKPIVEDLLNHGDHYCLLADFESYAACQDRVDQEYLDTDLWTRKSILNTARMGKFSSDRTIAEYCRDIWHVPVDY